MKVEQFYNKNQFVIRDNGKIYFQSYESVVAKCSNNTLTLGLDWDYSNTTKKYLYLFLIEEARFYVDYETKSIINDLKYCKNKRARIQKAIDDGIILYGESL